MNIYSKDLWLDGHANAQIQKKGVVVFVSHRLIYLNVMQPITYFSWWDNWLIKHYTKHEESIHLKQGSTTPKKFVAFSNMH